MQTSQKETQELFGILLMTTLRKSAYVVCIVQNEPYPHVRKPWKAFDDVVNELWSKSIAIPLKLGILESQPQLFLSDRGIDYGKFAHEHYPTLDVRTSVARHCKKLTSHQAKVSRF